MAESATNSTTRRYAVVTGANKGIGLEICRQLASDHGFAVILTARDKQRGLEAVEKLKKFAFLSGDDSCIFHQLDVTDPSSVASLAEFIKTKFGRLDILVNNAGMVGAIIDVNAFSSEITKNGGATGFKWDGLATETFELAEKCLQTNCYGAKRMIEALIPLLQSSNSPRIVNVSSNMGKLKNLPNKWAKRILNDEQNLTEERVDEVLNEYLKDFKEGSRLAKGWPRCMSANIISKASMNAYTRILAKKYPNFRVNAVCPGFVKTDINFNTGVLTVKEGAESAVKLVLVPNDGPSGLFFIRNELASFE